MTLFRSTFTELVFPFFLTFGVMSCILLMQRIYTLVSLMVEKKFELQEVALMLFYLLPQIFTITIPLGVVGAVFITVIRQSVDSEMVCLRATGTSLWVYSLPILLFGLLATGLTSFNSLWLSPYLYQKYAVLEAEIIKTHADEKLLPGKFNYDFGEKAIQVGARSPNNELSDIFIADRIFAGGSTIILASRGRIEVDEASEQVFFRLREGSMYAAASGDPHTFRTVDFARLDYRLEFRSQGAPSSSLVKREPTLAIWERIRAEQPASALYWRWAVEFFTRVTFPWSCLVFSLAAIPMAIVDPRSGRSGSFLRAIFLIVAYYIIWIAFKDLVKGGSAAPEVLWLPLILIGIYGLFRLWQINSDFSLVRLLFRR
jgi:lipopolysaccharide export system permease protein